MIGRTKVSKPIPKKWKTEVTVETADGNSITLKYELDDEFVKDLYKAVSRGQKIYTEISFEHYE